jgi:hypothetical protein
VTVSITPSKRDRILAAVDAAPEGIQAPVLADRFGVSSTTIRRLLGEAGYEKTNTGNRTVWMKPKRPSIGSIGFIEPDATSCTASGNGPHGFCPNDCVKMIVGVGFGVRLCSEHMTQLASVLEVAAAAELKKANTMVGTVEIIARGMADSGYNGGFDAGRTEAGREILKLIGKEP